MGLELAAGRMARLPVLGTPVVRQWHVAHLRSKRLSPAAAAFKAFLVEEGAELIRRTVGDSSSIPRPGA
jgi:DNA-binding transcriptional LysR family regulator